MFAWAYEHCNVCVSAADEKKEVERFFVKSETSSQPVVSSCNYMYSSSTCYLALFTTFPLSHLIATKSRGEYFCSHL